MPLPTPSRSTGLPTSTRPNPTNSSLRPISPGPSRPDRLSPASSSFHTRSRSQPPRITFPPRHERSASTTTRNEEDGLYDRDSGQPSSNSPLLVSYGNDSRQGVPNRGQAIMASSAQRQTPEIPYTRPTSTLDASSGNGQAIWSAVSTVASALTISVSKAWSANIPSFSGEETPPGQESRLTRAMKAYHIAKAQNPSDLPDWLFDERERRLANAQTESDDYTSDQVQIQASPPQTKFRPEPSGSDRGRISSSATHEPAPFHPQLRGTDRLKAMREARRPIGERDYSESFTSYTRQAYNSTSVPQVATQQPRIGLPSGPQRGRQ